MRGWWGEASSSMDTAHSQRTKSTTGQTQQHTRGLVSNGQTVITGGSAVSQVSQILTYRISIQPGGASKNSRKKIPDIIKIIFGRWRFNFKHSEKTQRQHFRFGTSHQRYRTGQRGPLRAEMLILVGREKQHQKDGGKSKYDSAEYGIPQQGECRLRTFKKLFLHKSNQKTDKNVTNFSDLNSGNYQRLGTIFIQEKWLNLLDSIYLDHVYFNSSC